MKRYILLLIFLFSCSFFLFGDDSIKSQTVTLDYTTCAPIPDGLIVFYDIDGLVINCKKIAASPNYCRIQTTIEGIDFSDVFKKRKIRYIKNKHYSSDDINYLIFCDKKKYTPHGKYYDEDNVEKRYMYIKFKSKLPIIIDNNIYYSYKKKKEAIRRYNYNDLTVYLLEPDIAKQSYGSRAKYGALIVNTFHRE